MITDDAKRLRLLYELGCAFAAAPAMPRPASGAIRGQGNSHPDGPLCAMGEPCGRH